MAKIDLVQLSNDTAQKITSSSEEWLKFCQSASNLYRYPFGDQLLIYAQRPDAKQCATMDFWNKSMGCYVNKGAKGIALYDSEKNRPKYVFDMSDVHRVSAKSRMPYQWEMPEVWQGTVANRLENKYMNTEIPYESMDFADRIIQIADELASQAEIDESIIAGSALEEVFEENRAEVLQDALSASVASMILTRCGVDVAEYADRLTGFQYINMFNTPEAVFELGNNTADLVKPVLIDIENEMKRLEKTNERSNENDRVQSDRGLSDSGDRDTAGERGVFSRQIRQGEGEIPEGTQEGNVRETSFDRTASETLKRSGSGSRREENIPDRDSEEELRSDNGASVEGLSGVSSSDSDSRTGSRASDYGRDSADLRTIILTDKAPRLPKPDPKRVYLKVTENDSLTEVMRAARRMAPGRIDVATSLLTDDRISEYQILREQNEALGIPTHAHIFISKDSKKVEIPLQPEKSIEIFDDADGRFGISVDGEDYSTYLTEDELKEELHELDSDDLYEEWSNNRSEEVYEQLSFPTVGEQIAEAEEAEENRRDYVFRTYAGASVSEPMLSEETITASSMDEAMAIAEDMADGKYYTVNEAYEPEKDEASKYVEVGRALTAELNKNNSLTLEQMVERQAESEIDIDKEVNRMIDEGKLSYHDITGKYFVMNVYDSPEVGSKTYGASIIDDALDMDHAYQLASTRNQGRFFTVKEVESNDTALYMDMELSKDDTLYIDKEHFADKIREIDPKPGTDIAFEVYDGESFDLTWHEPSLNLNYYPIAYVQFDGSHDISREGGENPESWKHFLHEVADEIDGKDTAKDIPVPNMFSEIRMGDQVIYSKEKDEAVSTEQLSFSASELKVGDIVVLPPQMMTDSSGKEVLIPSEKSTITNIEERSDGQTWISLKGESGSLSGITANAIEKQGCQVVGHDNSFDIHGEEVKLTADEQKLKDMNDMELARTFAKSFVSYDELEQLGYAFNGWEGEAHPMFSDHAIYGNGLHGDELINLAYRFKDGFVEGTDQEFTFDRDLALGLAGTKGNISFVSDPDGIFEVRDSKYHIMCGLVDRELSYEQISNAFLYLSRQEWEQTLPEMSYKIYQIKDGEEYHGIRFESLAWLQEHNSVPNHEDFDLVYEGKLAEFGGIDVDDREQLEDIFTKFNTDHPEDFKGHSLSMSDVVSITKNGEEKFYFCDRFGFREFPDFMKEKEVKQEIPLPNVTVNWSESSLFEEGKTYTVAEYDAIMHKADLEHKAGEREMLAKYGSFQAWLDSDDSLQYAGYDKTNFTVNFADGTSWTDRHDIGDGIGGLLEFVNMYHPERVPELAEAVGRELDKIPYQLVVYLKGDSYNAPEYRATMTYRTLAEAEDVGREFTHSTPGSPYKGFGIYDLEEGTCVSTNGVFDKDEVVEKGILGAEFKAKYNADPEMPEEKHTNLQPGDHLVDEEGVLWVVKSNGFMMNLEKANENVVDTLMASRGIMMWQDKISADGRIDIGNGEFFEPITIEEYLSRNAKETLNEVQSELGVSNTEQKPEKDFYYYVTDGAEFDETVFADTLPDLNALKDFIKNSPDKDKIGLIGISAHDPKDDALYAEVNGIDRTDDVDMPIIENNRVLLDMFRRYPDIANSEKAMSMVNAVILDNPGLELYDENGAVDWLDYAHKVHPYQVITYSRNDGGYDEKRDYATYEEAYKAAEEYLKDGYDGYGIYDRADGRIVRAAGDFDISQIIASKEEKKDLSEEVVTPIPTLPSEEQIQLLEDENFGYRSLISRDDIPESEKAEYRSKLRANEEEIGRLLKAELEEDSEKEPEYGPGEDKDWHIVHDADSEDGTPQEWSTELAEGHFVWIDRVENVGFGNYGVFLPTSSAQPERVFDTLNEAKEYVDEYMRVDPDLSHYIVESADREKVMQLERLTDPETFWDDVSRFTSRVTSDHALSRWQILAEARMKQIQLGIGIEDKTLGQTVQKSELGQTVYKSEQTNLPFDIVTETIKAEPIKEASRNFHITDEALGVGGAKEKFRRNIDAIKTLKQIEDEKRTATPEEQKILSQYVGWGGLADAFDDMKPNWNAEYYELKGLLSEDEYRAAKSSTLEAFYTSPTIINGIYDTLSRMGFEGGNILEPACGVGNFFGMLPEKMEGSNLYGVELDSISGRIAKALYPDAHIQVTGYEKTDFTNNTFDVAVGNVPFGETKPYDPAYKKEKFLIHDYFFAKTLDKVRPGGIVAFVTSTGTLDKENPKIREYIAQRAEFLGAVRLPGGRDGAFKANAGTEVDSDIIFLKKRDMPIDINEVGFRNDEWIHRAYDENGIALNGYFAKHPEQIVGKMQMVSSQFGEKSLCVADTSRPFKDQLKDALSNIQGEFTPIEKAREASETLKNADTIPAPPDVKNFSFTIIDDKLYFRRNGVLEVPKNNQNRPLSKDMENRIRGMVVIRDTLRELLQAQVNDESEETVKALQDKLNTVYDDFVKKFGRINPVRKTKVNRKTKETEFVTRPDKETGQPIFVIDRDNYNRFHDDEAYSLISALEKIDDNGDFAGKADIFTKRTIARAVAVSSVETASEALTVSLNERAKVDLEYMSHLCHKPIEEIVSDLRGTIFKNPTTNAYETNDEYLSGNIRAKLAIAKSYAENDSEMAVNISALEAVMPEELTASDIEIRLGCTWIDPKYIDQFMKETLHTPSNLMKTEWGSNADSIYTSLNPVTSSWYINAKNRDKENVKAKFEFGTARRNAYQIIEDTLNLKASEVYDMIEDENGNPKRVINKDETVLAQQKQELIKETFKEWIYKDPERRQELVKKYNEVFNSTRPRTFNGEHLTFPGSNQQIKLRPHQKDGVARILYGNNTLLAHCVGAGKTFTMVAGAMESKRLGLCKKSMFVVPNHLTEQWGHDFRELYPNANILVIGKNDFSTPEKRKAFTARIATGDYDAVIIGHSTFKKIQLSPEKQIQFLNEEVERASEARESIVAMEGGKSHSIKDIEKYIKQTQERIKSLLKVEDKDTHITFEELGVDRLFVDESHAYKNLFFPTKMSRVPGVNTSKSQAAEQMLSICRYMDEKTDGKGVTFATGTPISNSMTELYTNMNYLQHGMLMNLGLDAFDRWASTFGETTTAMEVTPTGTGYQAKTRFANFFNLPELMNVFKETADIRTPDMLNLPIPDVEYEDVVLEKSEIQQGILDTLDDRATRIKNKQVRPEEDNMLKITNDGRKMALDQRLYDPILPDNPNSKASACVEKAFEIYQQTMEEKCAQLIFSDLGTPGKDDDGNEKFSVYNDIKEKLIAKGVPAEEIAFIHDFEKDEAKAKLFSDVRTGKVRFLLGSTQKMGAGTNVQDRLIALHHIDVPWRPSDLEQQEGRILRQGNKMDKVKIFRYITKGTFDAYNWQTIEHKQAFISQIMTSKSPVRSHEDVDDATLAYAAVKALCADNPLIQEKMELDVDIQKLQLAKSSYKKNLYRLQDLISQTYPREISECKELITGFKADIATVNEHNAVEKDEFKIVLNGRLYEDKKEGAEALNNAILSQFGISGVYKELGSYRGLKISSAYDPVKKEFTLKLAGQTAHFAYDVGKDPYGTIMKMDNVIDKMPSVLEKHIARLENTETQLENAKVEVQKPFAKEDELNEKLARVAQVDAQLKMNEKVENIIIGSEASDFKNVVVDTDADNPLLNEKDDKEQEDSDKHKSQERDKISSGEKVDMKKLTRDSVEQGSGDKKAPNKDRDAL